jgi:hypothetical protein
MANACGLFGDLIPNIYIDRVTLEESQRGIDTDSDGKDDVYLQTPKVSVQLKVLDSESSGGNFSILGDALQIQTADSILDFKEYINVYCVIFTNKDLAEEYISQFESMNYTDTNYYFSLPQPESQERYYTIKQSLTDFTYTHVNAQNITEVLSNFTFQDFNEDSVFDYLRVFTFVQLDVEALEADVNINFPTAFKTVVGRYQDEVVLNNSLVVSQLTAFITEDGDYWDDSLHVHDPGSGTIYMEGRVHTPDTPHGVLTKGSITTNNVQDFRIRDQIDIFIADLSTSKSVHYEFPEQRDILNSSFSKNSYFSEIFITKDEERNGRFYFAFDYGKFILQEDKFANIISSLSLTAKAELIQNADLVKFVIKRKQVKERPARNHLGSPIKNRVQSNETIEIPVITSLGDSNITEIDVILTNRQSSDTSLVRHFTGVDLGLKGNTDGDFQYSIEIEAVSAFTTILNQILKYIDLTMSSYNEYVNLTQIPGIYDWQTRKYTTFGQQVLTNWDDPSGTGASRLATVIDSYTTALDYFVELDTPVKNGGGITIRESIVENINRNINPTNGSVDGIIMFQKMLSDLIGQISDILSVGSNNVGVEATRGVAPPAQVHLKETTMKIKETFDHTIGARFINDTYVDNISISPLHRLSLNRQAPGLRTYNPCDLGDASVTEVNPLNSIFAGTPQAAEAQGIIINMLPNPVDSRFNMTLTQDGKTEIQPSSQKVGSNKFVGSNSKNNSENLNASALSPTDLKKEGVASNTFAAPSVYQQIGSDPDLLREGVVITDVDTLTAEDLQTEVEVLTAFSRQSSTVTDNSYVMRNEQFEVKKLGDLSLALEPPQNTYFLCRQKQQGSKEVIDTFFLIRPVVRLQSTEDITQGGFTIGPTTSVAAQVLSDTDPANMTMEGVDLAAMFASKSGGNGRSTSGGISRGFGEASGLISTGELGPGVALQGTTGSPGGGADELL